ncbi:MAG: D-aminoacyl-tRNA deacylase [Chitinophagales bacterium]
MRVVIQRVSEASVTVDGKTTGAIGPGLLVLAGFEAADNLEDLRWMAGKVARLRIFNDAEGQMNLSVTDIGGQILLVSQFTLYALTKKGNRPSFIQAARPEQAIPLYESFITCLNQETGALPQTGIFGADMKVQLLNDGPVTITIDSRQRE